MAVRFVVAVRPALVDEVAVMAAAYIQPCQQWWEEHLEAARSIAVAADRRRALAELRLERHRRRAAGQHFDSVSAVVTHYVWRELDRRQWRRRWSPVPHGEAALPGRRWGSANATDWWPERLRIYLPDDLAELLRRATWHTCAPATRRLQQIAAVGPLLPKPLRIERDALRAEIVTTADVIRDAAETAVAEWSAHQP